MTACSSSGGVAMRIFGSACAARTYWLRRPVGEAFGSVYLEAMARLPVVATRTGGPPTFLNLDVRSPGLADSTRRRGCAGRGSRQRIDVPD